MWMQLIRTMGYNTAMWYKLLFIFFLMVSSSYAALPPTRILDEGVDKGVFFKLDCTGAGVECTQSGITGTMTVSGGGAVPQQAVVVAKADGDFATIQAAIDDITDNATGKRYVILIYPGTYTENITMEDFVSLQGVGKRSNVIIDGTVTFASDAGDNAGIENLKVAETTTTSGLDLITSPSSTGQHAIRECTLQLINTDNGDVGSLIDDDGGTLRILRSKLIYNFGGTNAGAATHPIIDLAGTLAYSIVDTEIVVDIDDVDDLVNVFHITSTDTGEKSIRNNRIEADMENADYAGTLKIFNLIGEAAIDFHITGNHIHGKASGGGTPAGNGYAYYLDSNGNTSTLSSAHNDIIIEKFGTKDYSFFADTGDTIGSHFDDVVAADEIQSGIVNTISSFVDGELSIRTGSAADPTVHFKTTNSANEVNFSLDESAADDILVITGQTASQDTELHFKAQDGENAVLKMFSGSNSGQIKYGSNDELTIKNNKQDENMNFIIDDGGVDKTITWDATNDTLEHSAGTFNFDDDALTTTAGITGLTVTATTTVTGEQLTSTDDASIADWLDIGGPTPASALHVYDAGGGPTGGLIATFGVGTGNVYVTTSTASDAEQYIYGCDSGGDCFTGALSNDDLHIRANNSNKMLVQTSGRVAINADPSEATLYIESLATNVEALRIGLAASQTANGIAVVNSADGYLFQVDDDGTVTSAAGLISTGLLVSAQMQDSSLTNCDTVYTDSTGILRCRTVESREKCVTLETPVSADDNIPFWHPHDTITITDVYCEVDGGTSADLVISDGTNVLESITCDEDGAADDGSIANGVFIADERMEFDLTVTGSVNWLNFCITYTVDVD